MTKRKDKMAVHHSSASNEWETPDWLYSHLNAIYQFDLDAAATKENAKCAKFYTQEDDALKQNWGKDGKSIWVNPPYGRLIGKFVLKAKQEGSITAGVTVVMLIPARVDTKWWHSNIANKAEVMFIKGRIGFVNKSLPSYREDGDFAISPAPFPTAIVIFGALARAGVTNYVDLDPIRPKKLKKKKS